jgi:hypothetical protein
VTGHYSDDKQSVFRSESCYDTPKPTRLGVDQREPMPVVAARESCELGKRMVALSKMGWFENRTFFRKDGRLPVREIRNVRLNADWVALSACGTGARRLQGEEGFAAWNIFLYAGVRSVFASLRTAPDVPATTS